MNSFRKNNKIAKILASLFTQTSTPEEQEAYQAWLKESPLHQETAKRILSKANYQKNNQLLRRFSSQAAWKEVSGQLEHRKSFRVWRSWKKSWQYAAVLLCLLLPLSYFLYDRVSSEPISEIMPGTQGGKIILSDGKTCNIPEGIIPEGIPEVFTIEPTGIHYQHPAHPVEYKEIKNTLQTQHGMEYRVTLADGTQIHLNAESRLTYPVCFSDKNRMVQIEGEAYFQVAPDSKRPFIVQTPHSSIEVTGTVFNVRAYPDENTENVTLIQGGVTVNNNHQKIALTPNQHFVYNKDSGENSIANVHAKLYTSWESGSFIFRNVSLENVMSYLSKWYGFKYVFEDDLVREVKIGAYLDRYANMNPIINMIKELNLVTIKQKDGILHISCK